MNGDLLACLKAPVQVCARARTASITVTPGEPAPGSGFGGQPCCRDSDGERPGLSVPLTGVL